MKKPGIKVCHPSRKLPDSLLAQLCYCKNDEARRLILGVSH